MADIHFKCPSCGDTLQATSDMSGDNIECPNCNNSIMVPQSSTIMQPIGGNKQKSNKKTIILGVVFIVILLIFMKNILFKKKKEPKAKPAPAHVETAQPAPAPEPEVETIDYPEDKINVGDTKDTVISTIGNPKSSMKMGSNELMIYRNAEITIGKDGKVISKQYRKKRE